MPGDDSNARVRLPRRKLLRAAAAAAALVSLAAGGTLAIRGIAPAAPGLRVLDAHAYWTLRALAETVIPRGGPFAAGAADMDLARAFDILLSDEPSDVQRDAARALLLVELGPVVYDRRTVTFPALSPDERATHWATWERSEDPLRRRVAVVLRRFLLLAFYGSDAAYAALGYVPGPASAP